MKPGRGFSPGVGFVAGMISPPRGQLVTLGDISGCHTQKAAGASSASLLGTLRRTCSAQGKDFHPKCPAYR